MRGEISDRLRSALGDRYEIAKQVGRGAMAIVYQARDLRHDRQVALKVLRPELAIALGHERFLREIDVLARLRHPSILPLYDSGEADGLLYYVMPFAAGETLRDRMTREKQLPVSDAIRFAREVAEALDAAHGAGIVHRDIKPENIILEHGHAMVVDFGIARAVSRSAGERLTDSGVTLGTPMYMSPEQASGETEIDGRSDIYSLGCVLYEMLAGEAPFRGPTPQAQIARRFVGEPPSVRTVRTTVPRELERAIKKTMAKAPADRFATAAELIRALDEASAILSGARPSVTTDEVTLGLDPRGRWWRSTAGRVVLAIALLLALAAAGYAVSTLYERDASGTTTR